MFGVSKKTKMRLINQLHTDSRKLIVSQKVLPKLFSEIRAAETLMEEDKIKSGVFRRKAFIGSIFSLRGRRKTKQNRIGDIFRSKRKLF
jgi:hypothetical protein